MSYTIQVGYKQKLIIIKLGTEVEATEDAYVLIQGGNLMQKGHVVWRLTSVDPG